jgi:hypothetical protein
MGSSWMNPGTYEPTSENTFLNAKKNLKKVARIRLHVLCVCIKFHEKITFFVACAKKTKNCVVERYLEALKFVFLRRQNKKTFFHKTLCPTHTFANMYAWNFLLNFLTFWNVLKVHFLKSGCICPWVQEVPSPVCTYYFTELKLEYK